LLNDGKRWWIINISGCRNQKRNPIPEEVFAEEFKLKKLSGFC